MGILLKFLVGLLLASGLSSGRFTSTGQKEYADDVKSCISYRQSSREVERFGYCTSICEYEPSANCYGECRKKFEDQDDFYCGIADVLEVIEACSIEE